MAFGQVRQPMANGSFNWRFAHYAGPLFAANR